MVLFICTSLSLTWDLWQKLWGPGGFASRNSFFCSWVDEWILALSWTCWTYMGETTGVPTPDLSVTLACFILEALSVLWEFHPQRALKFIETGPSWGVGHRHHFRFSHLHDYAHDTFLWKKNNKSFQKMVIDVYSNEHQSHSCYLFCTDVFNQNFYLYSPCNGHRSGNNVLVVPHASSHWHCHWVWISIIEKIFLKRTFIHFNCTVGQVVTNS